MQLLDSTQEWEHIVSAFKSKLAQSYDQETVIRSLTSLSLAQVKADDDFWQECFELIEKRIKVDSLDPFLKMNLLWSMGRNLVNLMPAVKENLIA